MLPIVPSEASFLDDHTVAKLYRVRFGSIVLINALAKGIEQLLIQDRIRRATLIQKAQRLDSIIAPALHVTD